MLVLLAVELSFPWLPIAVWAVGHKLPAGTRTNLAASLHGSPLASLLVALAVELPFLWLSLQFYPFPDSRYCADGPLLCKNADAEFRYVVTLGGSSVSGAAASP